jgi:cytolysin (calcineurin-like family phosphatase)
MSSGYRLKGKIDVGPRWSVPFSYIDTRYDAENWGTYEYKDYSLNYFVDLGPVDVYQLHRYGGDPDYGRRSGIEWLKRTLARRGYTRPVIIVQHFKLEGGTDDGLTNPTPGYDWTLLYTYEQRNHLLEVLLPYNVIAFGVGHWHDASVPFQMMPRFKNRKGTMDSDWKERVVPQFQPGAAMSGNLGVVRVEKSTDQKGGERVTLNYVQGNGLYNDKYISWGYGYSDDLPKPKDLYVRQLQVSGH